MSAFIRAVSPFVASLDATMASVAQAAAHEGTAPEPGELTKVGRHHRLFAAANVTQVVDMVPSDYRQAFRPLLLEVSETQKKIFRIQATISKWEKTMASGTLPAHIRQTAPTLQQTKEFAASSGGAAQRAALEKVHGDYLQSYYTAELLAKKDELLFLEGHMTPENIFERCSAKIKEVFDRLVVTQKVPRFVTDGSGATNVIFEQSPLVKSVHDEVLEDCLAYALRVIGLETDTWNAGQDKAAAKKNVHKALDVEMGDTASASGSKDLAKLVDERVKREVKKALAAKSGAGKAGSSSKPARKNSGGKNDGKKKTSGKASGGPKVSLQDAPSYLPPPLISAMKRNGGKVPLSEMKFKRKNVSAQKSTAQRQADAASSSAKGKGKGRAK
ncbi:uncharacterized protein C8Q71DRAFT_722885 [Rhodofomes roseus]|uniref:Uncharacterized protein n=1 Tax=Rhodofomes roseus TaxID=34475 RepID=A0ABQ8KKY7_9APHY|nr:uncharacterized protein C8Q71DRAFT_722885 [Rhodofomes roseus]KAH9838807.1 hypothetical protein C8Q71DRAFT_722885 [Rhodofomes roseus]